MSKKRINLKSFCRVIGGDRGRYPGVGATFCQDGNRIGTDGVVLVRVPTRLRDRSTGDVPQRVWRIVESGKGRWRPWPRRRRVDCGDEIRCCHCYPREKACPFCHGTGKIEPPELQRIGRIWILAVYDEMFRKFPKLQWRLGANSDDWLLIVFRFNGGDGAIIGREEVLSG